MKKLFAGFFLFLMLLTGCELFGPKWIAAPLSITVKDIYPFEIPETDPETVAVSCKLDFSGNIFPGNYYVYVNTIDDLSTATQYGPFAGTSYIKSLSAGVTYYFWVVAYGQWAGTTIYSPPAGSVTFVPN